ncbi:hypothetical protein N7467_004512 [Penicillium canescens]|nr:hypothetical protein N7467_004512 [Penicillium canescens]
MLYNALIRTHHITSRKKVAALKRAADTHQCAVLLRSGGCPGIMYVEGVGKDRVEMWVDVVRKLRYKDFQLVTRPGVVDVEKEPGEKSGSGREDNKMGRDKGSSVGLGIALGLNEVESVKEFGSIMAKRGVWSWWRSGMGYA